ncbi:MAG TPA: hypothetical protein PLC06_07735 [Promineifilum sp.]|nr:hypothetical protein [Promineifilum sp.]
MSRFGYFRGGGGGDLGYADVSGLDSSEAGALYQAAIIAALGLDVGERLGAVAAGGAAFETEPGSTPISFATLAEFLTGAAANLTLSLDVARYMGRPKAVTYSTTVTLRLDGVREADDEAADHDSDSLISTIACTGNCAAGFDGIDPNLAWQSGLVVFVNTGGGARTVSLATANGVTVTGLSEFPLGTVAGDMLAVGYTVISATRVHIDSIRAIAA